MKRQTQAIDISRGTRGSVVVKVLLIILGTFLVLTSIVFLIASIALMFDGDVEVGLFLMPVTLAVMVGGITIIVMQARGKGDAGTKEEQPRIVSVEPLGGSAPQAQAPTAQAAAEHHDANSSAPASPTEDVANLVYRSDDLFASLRDLVRHESHVGSDKFHLAEMLVAAGVMDWTDAPTCEGGRLSHNHHFWIRMSTDELTDEQYDMLVATEAALSVNQDLPRVQQLPLGDPTTIAATQQLLRDMAAMRIESSPLTDEGLRVCYHGAAAEQTPGEWVVRSRIGNAAESVSTPFRVAHELRFNLESGLVVLSLETPRPRCMAIFSADPTQQTGIARAYALRLAVLLATHAFDASPSVRRVVVNCHERNQDATRLSIDFDRTLLAALQKVAAGAQVERGFPTDPRIRASFAHGWFDVVEPFVSLGDPQATPQQARIYPELDDRASSPEVRRLTGATRISELGINENAARLAAWDALQAHLPTTTERAVQELVAVRDAASDITVVEACTRCIQALVDGKADLDDTAALGCLFIDGSALDVAVARSSELLDEESNHDDPEAAYQVLAAALAPIDDMGAYLDDETTVYRYFGSVAERVKHNLTVNEGGRTIKLVPDAYFNAHSQASIALGRLGRLEEALTHADLCLHLAPTSVYATLRKVRVLEGMSRIYEAADLIREALRGATTAHDAAVCHYRLAYMEWKLGREDLAAACYTRSLTWNTDMSAQARSELNDLLESTPSLTRPSAEQADALLAREGIPLGCVKTDGEQMLAAGVACIDDRAFYTGRALMASLFGMNSDDVVMSVYRSLLPTG